MVLALKDTADFVIPTKNLTDSDTSYNYSTANSINAYDRTYLDIINANRTKFFPPDKVVVERSTDSGSTWTTLSTSDFSNENRGKLMSDVGTSLYIGVGNAALTQQLRVTLQFPGTAYYCSLDRAFFRFSNSGHACAVTIEASTYGAQSTYTTLASNQTVAGWSGNNMVKFSERSAWGTNNSNHLYNIRFIFKYTSINSSLPTNQGSIQKIDMFGQNFWGTSNSPQHYGHLYSWDYLKNVTFPARLTAQNFKASGSGYPHIGGNTILTMSATGAWASGAGCLVLQNNALRPGGNDNGAMDLGNNDGKWRNLYLTGNITNGTYTYTLPSKSGTVALTSDTPPLPNNIAYIGSEVAGGGTLIEGSDIDWSTVASGADGEYILTKDNGTVSWKQHSYRRGDFLAITKNTTTLTWNGTSKTRWSGGTWTQYGPMATTTNPDQLVITTPADESWDVRLHHVTGSVQTNSKYGFSGIYRQASSGNLSSPTFMTESLTANGDLYIHQESETVVTIPAGTTWYFGVYVVTSSSTNNIWYGGGDTTATGVGFAFGNSCVLEATLIDKRKV